jgi:uncharacterized lipoprotein YmbA
MISPQFRKAIRWFALLATGVALFGCIGKSSPQVTFYSLLSMEQIGTTVAAPAGSDLKIGIGPITIPEALKRAQIVTRDAHNVYRFDEYHRWAGTLDKDIATILGDNLGDLLGTDKVASFPWMLHFKPTHRVIVDITQFDGELAGEAVLSARWTIIDQGGTASLASGRSVFRQTAEGSDYTALVKAESLLLADLSREVAQTIRNLPAQK